MGLLITWIEYYDLNYKYLNTAFIATLKWNIAYVLEITYYDIVTFKSFFSLVFWLNISQQFCVHKKVGEKVMVHWVEVLAVVTLPVAV